MEIAKGIIFQTLQTPLFLVLLLDATATSLIEKG